MKGYGCDICGVFYPGEPDFKVRHREGIRIMQCGVSVASAQEYDICPTCWGEKVQPAIWAILQREGE